MARSDGDPQPDDTDGELAPPVPPEVRRSARLLQLLVVALLLVAPRHHGRARWVRPGAGDGEGAGGRGGPTGRGRRLAITIHSAVAATELHGHKADDGTYLIEVEATVLNTGTRSQLPYDAVTLGASARYRPARRT